MAMKVEVEVDLFSGRPNPVWTLPEAEAAVLLQKLDALPAAPARALSGDLGYRGLLVRVTGGPRERRLSIQQGVIRVEEDETPAFLEDDGRALERWLLQTGRPFLSGELFALIEAQAATGG